MIKENCTDFLCQYGDLGLIYFRFEPQKCGDLVFPLFLQVL